MARNPSELGAEARAIFFEVVDLPTEGRMDVLDERCGEDRELRQLVKRLVDRFDLLGSPLLEFYESRCDRTGEAFGPFVLKELIGRGGWADVYLAARTTDVLAQPLAVKILRPSHGSLALEGDIQSRLIHEHIARLFEGSVTDQGDAYLAMEYVEGLPIDEYCFSKGLSIRQRLEIFLDVCAAVDHAHRNLIVHRDLKPSNIMVSLDGSVKVLDFGIAKFLPEAGVPASESQTDFAFTPEYASPEQVQRGTVTTASDVYSLGMVLYKMLAGRLPYRLKRVDFVAFPQFLAPQTIAEPSVWIQESEAGQTFPEGPKRSFGAVVGELDAIVLQALERDPERRYRSVSKLGQEIRCHLSDRSVEAYPGDWRFRTRRLLRRRQWELGVAVLLLTSLALVTHQRFLALEQASLARKEAGVSRQVGSFLVDVFQIADPSEARGRRISAREILESGSLRLQSEKEFEPAVRGRLLDAVGRIYLNLGLVDRAGELLELGLEIRRQTRPIGNLEVAESLTSLGMLRRERFELEEAEELLNEALGLLRQSSESEPRVLADTLEELGGVFLYAEDLDQVATYFRQALEIRQQGLAESDADFAKSWNNLGFVAQRRGRFDEAEELFKLAMARWRTAYGPLHPSCLIVTNNLASLYRSQGRLEEAEKLYRRAIDDNREVRGIHHPSLAANFNNLANLLRDRGDDEQAEALYLQAEQIWIEVYGPHHPDVAAAMNNRGELLRSRGELDEAERLYERACEVWRQVFGAESAQMAICFHNLGLVATMRGDFEIAEPLSAKSCVITEKNLGSAHPDLGLCLYNLARLHAKQGGEPERQEELYRRAVSIFEDSFDRPHMKIAVAEAGLGNLLRDQGRWTEAETLYRRALAALAELRLNKYLSRTLEYFREFLLARGEPADLAEASSLEEKWDLSDQ